MVAVKVAVEQEQSVERPMLCGSGPMRMPGQGGKKRTDLCGSHILGMAFIMKQHKAFDPADGCLFSADTAMLEAEDLPHLVEQSGLRLHATSR